MTKYVYLFREADGKDSTFTCSAKPTAKTKPNSAVRARTLPK